MQIQVPAIIFSQSIEQHRPWEFRETPLSIVELSDYWSSQSNTGSTNSTWNGRTCLAVVSYVLKFCSDSSSYDILSNIIRHLEYLASKYRFMRDDLTRQSIEKDISEIFDNSFMPEAKKTFFKVPKLQQQDFSDIPMFNEILAAFIHFLLQILDSVPDQISVIKNRYNPLQKELKFLLTYLGDGPFQCTQLQQVDDILAKFEMLANEAGNFICSCFFTTRPAKASTISRGIGDLSNKFKLLNQSIEEYCLIYGKLPIYAIPTPENVAVDSLFIVHSLIDDLENLINHRTKFTDDAIDQTMKIHNLLMSARSFLKGIESVKQDTRKEVCGELKVCVMQIRDVAYEAEYLINSYVVGNVPSWYLTLRLHDVIQKSELIEKRFKDINMIYEDRVLTSASDSEVSSQAVATETIVLGFEYETTKILEELTGGHQTLQLISLCGMGGLGKTTLAKKLYNHKLITDRFNKRAWVTISQTYQMKILLIDLLMAFSSNLEESELMRMSESELEVQIFQTLFGRRYLIVMDDVWSSTVWDDLGRFFPNNENGSRILFTSRNVDTIPTYSNIYVLPLMSEDQSWELLKNKVFGQESFPSGLEDIGMKIAEKCNGLPLAVVVIAGILANMKMEIDVWEEVKSSLDEHMSADPKNIMDILELSYRYLADHLKLCFLYLGAFPEHKEIPVRKLICLWIAEGFIQRDKDKSQEQVAEEYLMVLINRSLLSITKSRSIGGVKTCTIHDLLRDMCIQRAHNENIMTTIKHHFSVYQKHFRVCIHSKPLAYSRPFGLHCRSFLGHLSDPLSSFSQMKLLKILDLQPSSNEHYRTTEAELKRIDQLFHLRYLVVNSLPESTAMGNLINLEFLRMDSIATAKIYVPSALLKNLKLRHLHLRSEATFEKDCDTSQTNNLQTLSFIRIFDRKDEEILSCSPNLQKLKCICNETLFPDLSFLAQLKSLTMKFVSSFEGAHIQIKFPRTITKLALSGSGLSWKDMSIVGKLPNLQVLKLDNYAFVGEEWETREDEFQELKLLRINLTDLEKWITCSAHFPNLERIVLRNCVDLDEIPSDIGDIVTLQMIELYECSYESSLSAVQIEQEQRDCGNDELIVSINNSEWSKEKLLLQIYETSRLEETRSSTFCSEESQDFN